MSLQKQINMAEAHARLWNAIDRLAAQNPGLKVLFMSGYSEEIVASRLQDPDRRHDRREWGTELVAHVGGESGVLLDALLQRLGHVVE